MKHRWIALILAWGSMAGAAVELKTFTFRLPSYPATTQNCHVVALDLGKAFGTATGLGVLSARCLTQGASGFDMEIRYQAEKPIEPISTEYLQLSVYPRGRYVDEASCNKALPGKKTEFEKNTALPAVFSYCLKEPYSHNYSWLIRLDGFGTPKLAPFFGGFTIFTVPKNLTATQFRDGLADALLAQGAVLSDATIHSSMASGDVGIHYYAHKRLKFEVFEYTKTDKLDQCQNQVAELRAAFQTVKHLPGLIYCGYLGLGAEFESTVVIVGPTPLTSRQTIENYATFDDCERARPALVKVYQTEYKADVRGSACTRDNNVYRVVLLEP